MAQDARNILRHLSLMYSSHTTCGAQCCQCRCEYAHQHLNNCFPRIFFHKLKTFNSSLYTFIFSFFHFFILLVGRGPLPSPRPAKIIPLPNRRRCYYRHRQGFGFRYR